MYNKLSFHTYIKLNVGFCCCRTTSQHNDFHKNLGVYQKRWSIQGILPARLYVKLESAITIMQVGPGNYLL